MERKNDEPKQKPEACVTKADGSAARPPPVPPRRLPTAINQPQSVTITPSPETSGTVRSSRVSMEVSVENVSESSAEAQLSKSVEEIKRKFEERAAALMQETDDLRTLGRSDTLDSIASLDDAEACTPEGELALRPSRPLPPWYSDKSSNGTSSMSVPMGDSASTESPKKVVKRQMKPENTSQSCTPGSEPALRPSRPLPPSYSDKSSDGTSSMSVPMGDSTSTESPKKVVKRQMKPESEPALRPSLLLPPSCSDESSYGTSSMSVPMGDSTSTESPNKVVKRQMTPESTSPLQGSPRRTVEYHLMEDDSSLSESASTRPLIRDASRDSVSLSAESSEGETSPSSASHVPSTSRSLSLMNISALESADTSASSSMSLQPPPIQLDPADVLKLKKGFVDKPPIPFEPRRLRSSGTHVRRDSPYVQTMSASPDASVERDSSVEKSESPSTPVKRGPSDEQTQGGSPAKLKRTPPPRPPPPKFD